MTTPNIVPVGFANDTTDYRRVKRDTSGALRTVAGAVSVPSGTTATSIVGLVPFNAGARFTLNDKSIHCGDFGAASTTVSVGVIYLNQVANPDVPALFALNSTAPQSGGFVTLTNVAGLTFTAAADGWLAVTINTANADATANITFNVGVAYDA